MGDWIYVAAAVMPTLALWDAARRHYNLRAQELHSRDDTKPALAALAKRVAELEAGQRELLHRRPAVISKFQSRG